MLTSRINDPDDNSFGNFLRNIAAGLRRLVVRMTENSLPNINPYVDGISSFSSLLHSYKNVVHYHKTLRRRDFRGRPHIATFIWPIFKDLRDREIDFDESSSSLDVVPNHSYREKNEHWLIRWIYKRSIRNAVGIISMLNLAIMVLGIAGVSTRIPFLASMPVAVNISVLGLTAFYVTPMLGYYYLEKYVRSDLEKHMADVLARAEAGYLERAYQLIYHLPLKYRVLLHSYYPGNSSLRWSHLYIKIYLRHNITVGYGELNYEDASQEAVQTAENIDDKFKVIRLFLIRSDDIRKWNINLEKERFKAHQDEEHLKNEIATEEMEHAKSIGPYLSALPVHSKLHIQNAKDLHAQLDQVIELIQNGNNTEACKVFQAIELNGYNKVAFPAAAAKYYQIESVLVALLINKPPETRLHQELITSCDYLVFVRANYHKIQRYLDRFGSASHSSMNRKYAEYHDSCDRILWSNEEPPAEIPPNTPAWVMYKDRFISSSEDKLKSGELSRTSSLPNLLEHPRLSRKNTFS